MAEDLSPKQTENWRKILPSILGPFAFLMTDEQVQGTRDGFQRMMDLPEEDPIAEVLNSICPPLPKPVINHCSDEDEFRNQVFEKLDGTRTKPSANSQDDGSCGRLTFDLRDQLRGIKIPE